MIAGKSAPSVIRRIQSHPTRRALMISPLSATRAASTSFDSRGANERKVGVNGALKRHHFLSKSGRVREFI
jgi:hypothetical protein